MIQSLKKELLHVITENERVKEAKDSIAIRATWKDLVNLMYASHESLKNCMKYPEKNWIPLLNFVKLIAIALVQE